MTDNAQRASDESHNIDAVYCPHCNHVTLDPSDEHRARMERPPCPVYADEDRPDFDPKDRRWWHLSAEEKANNEAEVDGPFEVEWTRFGFIWGPIHVERIGDTDQKRVGVYITDRTKSVIYSCAESGGDVSVDVNEVRS